MKTLELLTGREQQLREELAALQLEYEQLRGESPIAGQGRDALTVDMTRVRELAGRIADLRRQRTETEMRLAALDAMGDDTLIHNDAAAIIDDRAAGSLTELQRQLRQAQVRAQELAKTLGPLHRDRIGAEQQVTGWKQQLGDEFVSLRSRLRTQRDILMSSEQELNRIYESERSKVKSLDTFLLRERQLTANIQRVEEIHQSILAKVTDFEMAGVALADGRASVQVEILEGPTLADTPVWPQPIPLLVLCGVLGSLSGAGYVAAREQLAQSATYERQTYTLADTAAPVGSLGTAETQISPPLESSGTAETHLSPPLPVP